MKIVNALSLFVFLIGGCGDNNSGDGGSSPSPLDPFLPEIPAPTGEAQTVSAGLIEAEADLITGPAQSGVIGDYFIRNSQAAFVIQSPARVIGVVPQGGNLVDAALLGVDGGQLQEDHFGELSMLYILGRTCEHETVEVLQTGAGGGVAAIRAIGKAAANDFISLRGLGLIPVNNSQNPDFDDHVLCATTYILRPDSNTLEVQWTLYNGGDQIIRGPFASFSDTGGEVKVWGPTRGFEETGIDSILSGGGPAPVDYVVYQGPHVAYGLMPRHQDLATPNTSASIAGVSVVLFNGSEIVDIINPEKFYLQLDDGDGVTFALDVAVGFDAADVEEAFQGPRPTTVAEVSGTVTWDDASPASDARVGLFRDDDNSGDIGPDDTIISYFDTDVDGHYSGKVPEGNYILRADVPEQGRSPDRLMELTASGKSGQDLVVPSPVLFDYQIVDPDDNLVPAKLVIVGRELAGPDARLHSRSESSTGLVDMVYAIHGSSMGAGVVDEPLALPAGGHYRVYATHGTEWSVDSMLLEPTAGDARSSFELKIRRVVDTSSYLATEYHVHSIGSPDSIVLQETRIATAVADGVELFAATDHDFVGVLQPTIEALGLESLVRSIPGIEITPFSFGHFNVWPIIPILESPNHGAIDWARNDSAFALFPKEFFGLARQRGAELVEANHPRGGGFQNYFDRAALTFDYDNRTITGDVNNLPVPNEFHRLPPDGNLWTDTFNALEIWNGFGLADANGDGIREIKRMETVMRDWFNFLSFGLVITPIGNSDTHTVKRDPMGMPRTMVRVPDDSPGVVAMPSIIDDVIDTLAGRSSTPTDVVVTDGPMIRVTVNGDPRPLGKVIDGTSGSVDITISVVAATWAEFDTVEIFANSAPSLDDPAVLEPLACFTSRPSGQIMANDPCALAPLGGARNMNVNTINLSGGFKHLRAQVTITIAATDIVNRQGATGTDAWFVVRARGNRSIFPIMTNNVLGGNNVDIVVDPPGPGALDALLDGKGIPASAFTSPFYVDYDGGGYTAVFKP